VQFLSLQRTLSCQLPLSPHRCCLAHCPPPHADVALQECLEAELAGRKEGVDKLTKELAELEEATGATQVGAGQMGRLGDGVADRQLTHRLGVCLTASCSNPSGWLT
jgi:hypothetical protein